MSQQLDPAEAATDPDPTIEHEAEGETYRIRRIEPEDVTDYLELHRDTELELGGSREWFAWKFERQPYLVHTPVFVADQEDEVVGARPFVPFRLRVGPRTMVGLQTADTVVHPDHRGRGLLSRMNDLAFAYYRQREPGLLFAIPNARSRPAYLDVGARIVGPIRTWLRIERPSTYLDEKLGDWPSERAATAIDGLSDGYHRLRDRRRNGHDHADIEVERHAAVPSETLADIAALPQPDVLHVRRDRAFYDWRFENPNWAYDSYVARRDGDPVAGLVAGTRQFEGRTETRIADVVPLAGETRLPAISALFERLLRTQPETDVFAVAGSGLPASLLRSFGFRPDDGPALSPLANSTVLITMPLTADDTPNSWTVEGRDLADPDSWDLPFCEHNTG
ncbi:Acetyltransferase (GNAT) domain-containing protein [Halorientalis persicus]|uniref:Acetyltransferase (GNAT) domain-containing protein n=1 Tax=Halorientalis persicus TaxID=1367881 RepID=A0A1H8SJG5_9EURY|nr:GNAT family N-acetyltransferase [Halorientalis persicus]SEO78771.1 Acetyltransferase (GNAT) domain-containing protein [Halorientalis persicus]